MGRGALNIQQAPFSPHKKGAAALMDGKKSLRSVGDVLIFEYRTEINAIKPRRVFAAASRVLLILLHARLCQSDLCRKGKKEADLPVTTQSVCSCACKKRQALMCACMCRHSCATSCSYLAALHLALVTNLTPAALRVMLPGPIRRGGQTLLLTTTACSVRRPASL